MTALSISATHALANPTQVNNQAIVEALYTKVLGDISNPQLSERMQAILDPRWQSFGDYTSPAKTREQFISQLQSMAQTAPNMTWSIEELLQVDNKFVVRGRAIATPVSHFFGIPASGKQFDIMAIDIHTVVNGKIITSYHVEDWQRALSQLQSK